MELPQYLREPIIHGCRHGADVFIQYGAPLRLWYRCDGVTLTPNSEAAEQSEKWRGRRRAAPNKPDPADCTIQRSRSWAMTANEKINNS